MHSILSHPQSGGGGGVYQSLHVAMWGSIFDVWWQTFFTRNFTRTVLFHQSGGDCPSRFWVCCTLMLFYGLHPLPPPMVSGALRNGQSSNLGATFPTCHRILDSYLSRSIYQSNSLPLVKWAQHIFGGQSGTAKLFMDRYSI